MKAIVIVLNHARPDFIGAYGAEAVATPNLDRLAADGVVFDQHYADRPSHKGARRSWNTGGFCHPVTLRAPMGLAQRLWQAQVRSVLVGGEQCPSRGTPFTHGWETTLWLRRNRLAEINQPTMVDGTLQLAIDWLESQGNHDRWCMWVEVDALRPPWDPSEYADALADSTEEEIPGLDGNGLPDSLAKDADQVAEASQTVPPAVDGAEEWEIEPNFDFRQGIIRNLERVKRRLAGYQHTYGGVLAYVDDLIGQFVSLLRELTLYDETLLIVTSDLGLPLGEHGQVGTSRPWLHEELVHLPLIIRMPHGTEAGRRVQQLTQPVDLHATLADYFQFDWNPACGQGQSWLPILSGKRGKLREYACSRLHRNGLEEWAIRTSRWHLLLPQDCEDNNRVRQLYVKPDDRWEVNNVAAQYPEIADHLELVLRRYMATAWRDPLIAPPPLREDLLQTGT